MLSLKELNTKISSLQNTNKITKAMKLIAANKLTKRKNILLNSRHYKTQLDEIIRELDSEGRFDGHFFLQKPKEVKCVHLLVISSEKGLCGAYNGSIFRELLAYTRECKEKKIDLHFHLAGKKGEGFFQENKNEAYATYDGNLLQHLDIGEIEKISRVFYELFETQEAEEIYVLYTHFYSAFNQKLVMKRILPLSFEQNDLVDGHHHANSNSTKILKVADRIFEPNEKKVVDNVLRQYIDFSLWDAFVNAQVSEQASRMTAMENATKNSFEMIDSYTLERNRVRQASITTELSEIVSGAEALKK